ncbi:MAG: hemolysin-like protein [Micavibrio aeruginosavorus]|uniref:Hemolysin-like protein n=1 Tax=Micavibrio aeruginosavorus TaxID=349221 RepID=A0A2W5HIF2_9BACT|nr:MAG: hemolysin-like protein [Micavibrio aeruginosavorus]
MLAQIPDSGAAPETVSVRLAETPEEILAAQKLRYKVFYEECGAIPTNTAAMEKRDFDKYDDIADHLIALDPALGKGPESIIGTYRLIRQDRIPSGQSFYTSGEFDIMPFLTCGGRLLELGRSCILPEYRTRQMLQRMWQGITGYVTEHNIDLMFGCASFHGTDVDAIQKQLAYLYHFHKAPKELCPTGIAGRCVDMNRYPKEALDQKAVFHSLPSLIKGYLRIGATIGDGAYVDHQFNTIDVCIVMPTYAMSEKYLKHWERLNARPMPKNNILAEKIAS